MLKKKSNKLIALLLSVLLSGLIPAAVTLANDGLIGDADGILAANAGGQPGGSLNPTLQYQLQPGVTKSFPISVALLDGGNDKKNVAFPVNGIATLTTNPGGAIFTTTPWTLLDYFDETQTNFQLEITAPTQPGKYTYVVTFEATNNLDNLKPSVATASIIVTVPQPETLPDTTQPTLGFVLNPDTPNGENGWYTSSVDVVFNYSDELGGSGIDPLTIPADFTISQDGITPETKYTVKDMAGNTGETTVPEIKLDTTDPVITINIPEDKAVYKLNEVVNVDWSAIDATSGIDTANTFADSTALNTSSLGNGTFTVTATDNAGNSTSKTVNYTVIYDFKGFFQPVDMSGVLNVVKAGSSIPIKFSLGGDRGLNILSGTPGVRNFIAPVGTPEDTIEEILKDIATSGNSNLSYDSVTEIYTYVWKTDKTWIGNKQLVVKFIDGTSYTANFKFK